jgi:hypothetical protein
MNSIDSKFAKNNGVLSSSGQTFKKLIERLSPSKQREIMATYSAPRMRALSRSDKFQLAGLPTRFQGPKDYKKNAGFYYNPNGYEYALSLQKDHAAGWIGRATPKAKKDWIKEATRHWSRP